jgi:hypothetical protein
MRQTKRPFAIFGPRQLTGLSESDGMNATDDTNTAEIAAESQAVMDQVLSGRPLDAKILERIEQRRKRIRQEIMDRLGVLDVAVELVREARDEV